MTTERTRSIPHELQAGGPLEISGDSCNFGARLRTDSPSAVANLFRCDQWNRDRVLDRCGGGASGGIRAGMGGIRIKRPKRVPLGWCGWFAWRRIKWRDRGRHLDEAAPPGMGDCLSRSSHRCCRHHIANTTDSFGRGRDLGFRILASPCECRPALPRVRSLRIGDFGHRSPTISRHRGWWRRTAGTRWAMRTGTLRRWRHVR